MKYIEEYISKLHIHQHSLLNRKVFFRHNFQHWSSSLYQLDHLIFKSSSSSSHLHLQVIWIWIISRSGSSSLDWIWIITRSRSLLLDLDHHSIWISRSHHNWIWIITRSGSSLVIIMCVISCHRKFYRASPFSC